MIVITAFSGDDGLYGTEYSEIIEKSRENANRFGYPFHIYYTFVEGKDKRYHWKPEIIYKALEMGETIVYLDGDALIVEPFELPNDFDLGLCVRGTKKKPARPAKNCINAGVIFARNRDNLTEFIQEWVQRQNAEPKFNDQYHLNRILEEKCHTLHSGDIIEILGAKVRIFSCKKYNSWYWRRWEQADPYILHFKRSVRRKYKQWAKENA